MGDFSLTSGRVCSVDDEIEMIEDLVETNRVSHMITVVVEPLNQTTKKIHVATAGAQLIDVHAYLKQAISAVENMIGAPLHKRWKLERGD